MRSSRFEFRLAPDELAAVQQAARQAGLSVSEYTRRKVFCNHTGPVIRIDHESLHRVYIEHRRAGNNLNQCARELHKYHSPNHLEQELAHALASVAKASDGISALLAEARKSI